MRFIDKIKHFIEKTKKDARRYEAVKTIGFIYNVEKVLRVYFPEHVSLGIRYIDVITDEDKLEIGFLYYDEHNELVLKDLRFPLEFLDMPIEKIKKRLVLEKNLERKKLIKVISSKPLLN